MERLYKLRDEPPRLPTREELVEQAERWHAEGRVRAEVLDRLRAGHLVTVAEYLELRANSYERRLLYYLFDDAALALCLDYCCTNTQACFARRAYPLDLWETSDHYDQLVALVLAPLAAHRLRLRRAAQEARDLAERLHREELAREVPRHPRTGAVMVQCADPRCIAQWFPDVVELLAPGPLYCVEHRDRVVVGTGADGGAVEAPHPEGRGPVDSPPRLAELRVGGSPNLLGDDP